MICVPCRNQQHDKCLQCYCQHRTNYMSPILPAVTSTETTPPTEEVVNEADN